MAHYDALGCAAPLPKRNLTLLLLPQDNKDEQSEPDGHQLTQASMHGEFVPADEYIFREYTEARSVRKHTIKEHRLVTSPVLSPKSGIITAHSTCHRKQQSFGK